MSTKSASEWVSRSLQRIAKQQQASAKNRPRPISRSEQIRRYVEGEERWRLESGLVTPDQWQKYVDAMDRLISEV